MSRNIEREEILQKLSSIYQNTPCPNDEVISSYINSINSTGESLLGVQTKIRNDYIKDEKKKKLRVTPFPNFLVVDTPNNNEEYQNFFNMTDGIKIYLPVDPSKIYKVATSIIDFTIKKKIAIQCKVRNFHANDTLTIRATNKDTNKEDINAIIEYVNKKHKKDLNKGNPFIPEIEGINTCSDGQISYNRVLAKLLDKYLYDKKLSNTLNMISEIDFSNFIKEELNNLQGKNWHYYYLLYGLKNKRMYQDFVLVSDMIRNNMVSELSLDDIEKYQKMKKFKSNDKYEYTDEETDEIKKKALREIFVSLKNSYDINDKINNSIEYLHRVIMDYIDKNNIRAFTRNNKIRYIIDKYYPKEVLKEYLLEMGYDTLINAAIETKLKYGDKQMHGAIKKFIEESDLAGFTNTSGYRSELGFIVPSELLIRKLKESDKQGNNLISDNIIIEREERKISSGKSH